MKETAATGGFDRDIDFSGPVSKCQIKSYPSCRRESPSPVRLYEELLY